LEINCIDCLKNIKNQTFKSTFEWSIIIALLIAPLIIGAIYIRTYGVNVPYWDQWDTIPIFLEKLYSSKLTFFDLIAQHNESRPFFPNIVMIILAKFTHYNVLYEMYFMYAFYCVSFVILCLMYVRDHHISKSSCLKFIPVSLFFFNLFQISNMLSGVRIGQSMEIFGLISSLYLIDKSKNFDLRFLSSIIAAIISTFSFVAGLSTWPVCLTLICLKDSEQKRKKIVFWCFSTIAVVGTYFHNYGKPGGHPSLLYSLQNPVNGILDFLSSFGSTISRDLDTSRVIGILMLILLFCVFLLNRKSLVINKNAKWFALILYSLLTSLEISMGRSGFGTESMLSQRYYLLTYWSIIALYLIELNYLNLEIPSCKNNIKSQETLSLQKRLNYNYLLMGIILTLLFIGITTYLVVGIEEGKETKTEREHMAYYLENYEVQPIKNLKTLYPELATIHKRASFLESENLSVFYNKG
jgi:hypothetical protein